MKNKISIIVPVYNVEKYINRCIDSLLNQTLRDIEIILVDDGSPDNCPNICNNYAQKDTRIKVIHKKNEGLGMARNSGLDIATGEYVMFIDSDDHIDLDACNQLYKTMKKNNADVVSGFFNIEKKNGTWYTSLPKHELNYTGNDIYQYALDMVASAPHVRKERLHPVSVCLLCIRRELIESNKLRFFSERVVASEDSLFKISLLKHAKRLIELPYAFYYYHLNQNSLTHSFKLSSIDKLLILRQQFIQLLGNNPKVMLRVNRFIISDIRMLILNLIQSNEKKKIALLRMILHHQIWNEIKSYKSSYFSIYPRIFYLLCLHKCTYLLYCFALIIISLKKRF